MVVGVACSADGPTGAGDAVGEAVLAHASRVVGVSAIEADVDAVSEHPIDKHLVVARLAVEAGRLGAEPTELHGAVGAGRQSVVPVLSSGAVADACLPTEQVGRLAGGAIGPGSTLSAWQHALDAAVGSSVVVVTGGACVAASAVEEEEVGGAIGAFTGRGALDAVSGTVEAGIIAGVCTSGTGHLTTIAVETVWSDAAGAVGGSATAVEAGLVAGLASSPSEVGLGGTAGVAEVVVEDDGR